MANQLMFTTADAAAGTTSMIGPTMKPKRVAETRTRATSARSAATKVDRELINISSDTALAMRYVRNARMNIFNGMPHKARVFAIGAATRINAALADNNVTALDIREPANDLRKGEEYVPFIANLAIVEDFTRSEAKTVHVEKANSYLRKGEPGKALHELHLGNIDVVMTSEMVPLKLVRSRITSAANLIGKGKYIEANLALKAVEDSVVIETFGIGEIPKTRNVSERGSAQ